MYNKRHQNDTGTEIQVHRNGPHWYLGRIHLEKTEYTYFFKCTWIIHVQERPSVGEKTGVREDTKSLPFPWALAMCTGRKAALFLNAIALGLTWKVASLINRDARSTTDSVIDQNQNNLLKKKMVGN